MLRNWCFRVSSTQRGSGGGERSRILFCATEINDTHNVIFFLLSSEKPVLESLYFYFFSCIIFGPGHLSPGLGCSACRFCTKKDTHTHTIMIPSPGAEGRGPGMVPQAGSSAQAGASGRVHSSVSYHSPASVSPVTCFCLLW